MRRLGRRSVGQLVTVVFYDEYALSFGEIDVALQSTVGAVTRLHSHAKANLRHTIEGGKSRHARNPGRDKEKSDTRVRTGGGENV
jgi:hypothetical protein